MFLNNFKTAEHSLFDSVHELGHLVLHQHAGPQDQSRAAEREANAFASAFLMPANDVKARAPRFIDANVVIKLKGRWRVSAMAMAYRLHALERLTEWQYKSICIELGKRGYRSGEPNGIEREASIVWRKVLAQLWQDRTTKNDVAAELKIPLDELEGLIWGVASTSVTPPGKRSLHLI
ncbi:ImmA/IrrE family metallo-endopeptidase [Rhizobium sp. G21]|uniref:ImmA/IrrE family metallo-endopeptidase n=1 Tax=Rhizobium sp. G21 TaxID=2758439 RepID=UPI0028AA8C2F|nr:ImmA/IrrE family metallo-endopeptidase [Rhizobium sp. G21]